MHLKNKPVAPAALCLGWLLIEIFSLAVAQPRPKARIRDSLAAAVCHATKRNSENGHVFSPLKDANQSATATPAIPADSNTGCRNSKWTVCAKCQKFSYVPCSPQHSSLFKNNQLRSQTKIVLRRDALPHEFPYIVRLRLKNAIRNSTHGCGGSIYNEDWIITAAHCVDGMDIQASKATAGDHQVSVAEPSEQERQFFSAKAHEQFNRNTKSDDIALVQVKPPFEFNEFVQPVPLHDEGAIKVGQVLQVSGSGKSFPTDSKGADILATVEVQNDDLGHCAAKWQNAAVIDEKNICTVPIQDFKSVCHGDSGGPLVIVQNGSHHLVGVVNGALECSDVYPNLFASISYFREWIIAHSNSENC